MMGVVIDVRLHIIMAVRQSTPATALTIEKGASMDTKDLSPELQSKVAACETPEEILSLAQAEGYELSEEELADVAGAGSFPWNLPKNCPSCGSENIYHYTNDFYCRDCGYQWQESGI